MVKNAARESGYVSERDFITLHSLLPSTCSLFSRQVLHTPPSTLDSWHLWWTVLKMESSKNIRDYDLIIRLSAPVNFLSWFEIIRSETFTCLLVNLWLPALKRYWGIWREWQIIRKVNECKWLNSSKVEQSWYLPLTRHLKQEYKIARAGMDVELVQEKTWFRWKGCGVLESPISVEIVGAKITVEVWRLLRFRPLFRQSV